MKKGKVIWFNKEKGHGIIRGAADGVSYFAHFSEIRCREKHKNLRESSTVTFLPTTEQVHPNVFKALRIRKAV